MYKSLENSLMSYIWNPAYLNPPASMRCHIHATHCEVVAWLERMHFIKYRY